MNFESHITVSRYGEDIDMEDFNELCEGELTDDTKPITIYAFGAEMPKQVMTSNSFDENTYLEVLEMTFQDVDILGNEGFEVQRVKVEAKIDEDIENIPILYAEAHIKIIDSSYKAADLSDSIEEQLRKFDARPSRNMADKDHRFINIRRKSVSAINDATDGLVNVLLSNGILIKKIIKEAVLLDTNPGIDKGWIDAPVRG